MDFSSLLLSKEVDPPIADLCKALSRFDKMEGIYANLFANTSKRLSGHPFESTELRLTIPSQNRNVPEAFVLETSGECSVYWHRGYIYDFFGWREGANHSVDSIVTWLERFFQDDLVLVLEFNEYGERLGGDVCEHIKAQELVASPNVRVFSWSGLRDSKR